MEPCSPASPDPDALCGSTLPSSDALIHRCATKRGKLRFCVVYVCMTTYGFYLIHMNGDNHDACFHSHELPHTVGGYSREGLLTVVPLNSSIPVNATEKNESVSTFLWNLKVTEMRVAPFSVSLTRSLRGGLHYPGQSSLEQNGSPRLVWCRNAPAICCTLELDLQPNSISSPSQCHWLGRGGSATSQPPSKHDRRESVIGRKILEDKIFF